MLLQSRHHYCANLTCVTGAAMTAGTSLELTGGPGVFHNANDSINEGLLTGRLMGITRLLVI